MTTMSFSGASPSLVTATTKCWFLPAMTVFRLSTFTTRRLGAAGGGTGRVPAAGLGFAPLGGVGGAMTFGLAGGGVWMIGAGASAAGAATTHESCAAWPPSAARASTRWQSLPGLVMRNVTALGRVSPGAKSPIEKPIGLGMRCSRPASYVSRIDTPRAVVVPRFVTSISNVTFDPTTASVRGVTFTSSTEMGAARGVVPATVVYSAHLECRPTAAALR